MWICKKIVKAKVSMVSQAEDDMCQSVRVSHATELWCQSAPARLFPAIIVCNMKQWPDFPSFFGWGRRTYTYLPTYNLLIQPTTYIMSIFFGSHVAWGALGYEPNLRSHYLFCSAQLVKTSWVRLAIIKHISTLHIRYRFLHKVYAVYLGLGNLKCLKTDVNARYLICHRLKILLWICLACVSHATRMTLYLQLCTLF